MFQRVGVSCTEISLLVFQQDEVLLGQVNFEALKENQIIFSEQCSNFCLTVEVNKVYFNIQPSVKEFGGLC